MAKWSATTSIKRLTVNGKTYNDINEMPPEVRQQYEEAMKKVLADRDGNGVPDIMEGKGDPSNLPLNVTTSTTVHLNGKPTNLEDLPPEIRQAINSAHATDRAAAMTGARPMHAPANLSYRRGAIYTGNEDNPGGITIRLTWPMILFVAIAIAAVVFVLKVMR